MVPPFIHKSFNSLGCIALLTLSMSGCRLLAPPEQTTRPSKVDSPVTFIGNTDTTSLGDADWRTFFSDPDLESLIDTALARNPDVQIMAQRVEMARSQFQFTRGALVPTVDAVVSAGFDKYGTYTMNGVGNFDTNLSNNVKGNKKVPNPAPDYFLGFRSTWEIDLWGKLRNRKQAAFVRFLSSEKGRHLMVTSLVAEVARLYYTLLALDAEMEIIRENIRLQQTAVELVDVQKAAGRVTELAVQQFTAQLLNTRSLEGQVHQQIVETENQLNLLLGRFPQPIARRKNLRDQQLPALVRAGVPMQMLRRRPDIRQAELEMEAARIDVEVARAEFLPSLALTPYLGLNAFRASVLFDPASVAMGMVAGLTAPVFNRRYLKANYNLSEARSREAFLHYQKAILSGFSDVVTDLRGIENFRNVANLKAQEVAMLEQATGVSKELFATGYASYLEVITAQRSVLEAKLAQINVKRAQFHWLIDLYRSLGGGWQ
ncbi:TolC family protein [Larkinella soli]|uniref:TolC family protein n=1 Tax=Larkinella soli TaxID=1770527 RepID=UPI000FFC1ADA|nr:TolC family protein [Larkinella soli]